MSGQVPASACRHENFHVDADVTRILNGVEEADGGAVTSYMIEVKVRCVDCDQPFGWRGMPCGVSVNGAPMRGADALDLRAWLLSPAELALVDGPAGLVAP